MSLLKLYGDLHYNGDVVDNDSGTSRTADSTLEEQPMSHAPHEADSVPEATSTPFMESTIEPASTTLTPQESVHDPHEAAPAIDESVHPIEEDYPQPVYEAHEVAPATDEPV